MPVYDHLTRHRQFERVREVETDEPFLAAGGSGAQFKAGIERAIAIGWPWRHESGTYVKFTDRGAVLFG